MHPPRIGRRDLPLAAGFVTAHLLLLAPAASGFALAMSLAIALCALLPRRAALRVALASTLLAGVGAAMAALSGGLGTAPPSPPPPWQAGLAGAMAHALGVAIGAALLRRGRLVARRYDSPATCLRFLVLGAGLPVLAAGLLLPPAAADGFDGLMVALPIGLATLAWWSDRVEVARGFAQPPAEPLAARRARRVVALLSLLACAVAIARGRDPAPWLLAGLAVEALSHGPRAVSAQAGVGMLLLVVSLAVARIDGGAGLPALTDPFHLTVAVAVPLLFATVLRGSRPGAAPVGTRPIGPAPRQPELDEVRALARRMTHLAHHDPLTGLPNRRLLLARLQEALRSAQASHRRVALLFIDLDGFKSVNDAHGHALGDALLRAVAQRLRARVRAGDTVCRLAGDEFVVLLPAVSDRDHATEIAQLLRAALARPFAVKGRVLRVQFSGGIAVAPDDGTRAEALLERADAAMYEAKRGGRGHVHAGAIH